MVLQENRLGPTGESVTVLGHGRHGCCFALVSLPPVLPSEPRDNLKIALFDKLHDNTAEISAILGVLPQKFRSVLFVSRHESRVAHPHAFLGEMESGEDGIWAGLVPDTPFHCP